LHKRRVWLLERKRAWNYGRNVRRCKAPNPSDASINYPNQLNKNLGGGISNGGGKTPGFAFPNGE